MFIQPSLYMFSVLFCLLIYWLIFNEKPYLRAVFLTVFSVALIALVLPQLAMVLLLSCGIAYSYKFVQKKHPSKIFAAIAIFLQMLIMWAPDLRDLDSITLGISLVGLSYFTLRNIGVTIDIYKNKVSPSYLDILFLNSFFPTYSAGPVENLKTFDPSFCDVKFDLQNMLMGLMRFFLGVLKFYFIVGEVLTPFINNVFPSSATEISQASFKTLIPMVLILWVKLYISFSGYADIAIGSSKMFGIKVRENFNAPFLATNIQKYWQRWNISIMNFVSEYFYLNFVRSTGRRVLGIFLAFFVMGMWHHLSWNYVIWSFGHGLAMAGFMLYRRTEISQKIDGYTADHNVIKWLIGVVTGVITILFVSYLSAIATAQNSEIGLAFLEAIYK